MNRQPRGSAAPRWEFDVQGRLPTGLRTAAVARGELIPAEPWDRQCGFRVPVHITPAVLEAVAGFRQFDRDDRWHIGGVQDLLGDLRKIILCDGYDEHGRLPFELLLPTLSAPGPYPRFVAQKGSDDDGHIVVTIGVENEMPAPSSSNTRPAAGAAGRRTRNNKER
jgi:hypothetical protein